MFSYEMFATRDFKKFEGMYEKIDFSYNDFWKLTLEEVKEYIGKN